MGSCPGLSTYARRAPLSALSLSRFRPQLPSARPRPMTSGNSRPLPQDPTAFHTGHVRARLKSGRDERSHRSALRATVLRLHRRLSSEGRRERSALRFIGGHPPPTNTRPLALRNTDAKLAVALANGPLRAALPMCSAASQQGYTTGRLPARDILWLGTVSRAATLASVGCPLPPGSLWETLARHHAAYRDPRAALQVGATRRQPASARAPQWARYFHTTGDSAVAPSPVPTSRTAPRTSLSERAGRRRRHERRCTVMNTPDLKPAA